ncbi:DUF3085 domain-containing protein [Streptomyces zhihengii]
MHARLPLDKVLATAEHAASADQHKLGYEEKEAAPRLWWVKDDGTYLMSNGKDPVGTRDEDGHPPHMVHATGWGPGTDARSILGGDDFRESLNLTTPSTTTAAAPCSTCSAPPPPAAAPASS